MKNKSRHTLSDTLDTEPFIEVHNPRYGVNRVNAYHESRLILLIDATNTNQEKRALLRRDSIFALCVTNSIPQVTDACHGRDSAHCSTSVPTPSRPTVAARSDSCASVPVQPLQDVPTAHLRRALRPHVHCWECRTNRICDVPSCMCCRLRSMRGCHGRNLLRAVLRYLSARLRRRVVGSNTITKPTNAMPSRQKQLPRSIQAGRHGLLEKHGKGTFGFGTG